MKARTVFAIVGWGLLGFMVLAVVLHALLQLSGGIDTGYRTYRNQYMTYMGQLAMLAIMVLIGVVGLYYRAKRFLGKKAQKRTEAGRESLP